MNIVNADREATGGQVERLSRAINETYGNEYSSRAFTYKLNYIKFPVDVLYNKKWHKQGLPDWALKIWKEADVYHLHNIIGWLRAWPLGANPKAGEVLHIHSVRNTNKTPEQMAEMDKGKRIRVVSTPSLLPLVFYQKHRWFPTPIDFPLIEKLRKNGRKNDGIFRVVHAPTVNKDTEEFLTVMKLIEQKHKHVKTVIVRKQTHMECLRQKSVGDIYFDSIRGGVGSNGLESMVMRMPVIAGCANNSNPIVKGTRTVEIFKDLNDGDLPFITATKKTLFEVIEELILNADRRKTLIDFGIKYVEKYHTFEFAAKRAIITYKEAIWMKN